MFLLTEEYKHNIAQSWRTFVQEDCAIVQNDEHVRKVVYDSWVRSRKYKVDPQKIITKTISRSELESVLRKKEKLISVAKPYMESLYSFIKGFNFVVSLSDENGYVIHMLGDDELITRRTCASHLCLGSVRSEKYAGTNAIGTCLYLGEPLQLYGEEHYVRPNHTYACASAPIRDESDRIIGCLNFTGPKEQASHITLSVAVSAVNGIEKGMRIRTANEGLSIVNKQLSTILQSISSGIIMIDQNGVVTQFNNQAASLLRVTHDRLQGGMLAQLFGSGGENPFLEPNRNVSHKEINLTTLSGYQTNLSISTTAIFNDDGEKIGTIIAMDELKSVHKLVNKLSGFTAKYTFDSIIGNSEAISSIKKMGQIASQSESNVLILGESGTGKELVAQAIHNGSPRAAGPFIAINCGSLPKGLIESELFGYDKGAFTGASRDGQPGKFELADGGTVFLDEIGDMPLDLQVSLLRVLQTKEIIRIGGSRSKPVDVRIIAATNADLENAIENNTFRSDLYYRLNVFTIELPALRNHPEDILPLTDHFIKAYSSKRERSIKGISPKVSDILLRYNWPGNIRELENTIERAVNLCETDLIDISDLPQKLIDEVLGVNKTESPASVPAGIDPPESIKPLQSPPVTTIQDAEYDLIVETITKTYGNMKKAAELLGISRRSLYYKTEKYKINVDEYR